MRASRGAPRGGTTRATSSRNGGRNHLGTPIEIKSEWRARSSRIRGRHHPESAHENWLEQHRYLNMDDLREHKKEVLRRAA